MAGEADTSAAPDEAGEEIEVPTPADALPADAWQDEDWEKFLGEYYSGGQQAAEESAEEDETTATTEDSPQADSARTADAASSPEPSAGSDDVEAEGAGGDPAVAPPAPDFIEIGSQRIPAEHAERVAAFWQWMNEYPEQAMEFMGYLNGEYTLTPAQQAAVEQAAAQAAAAPAEPKPRPEDEDWTFVPDSVKDAIAELDEIKGRFETYDQWVARLEYEREQEAATAAVQAINMGVEKFREQYDVSDQDLEQLRIEAGRLGVADRLAQQYGDPVRAVAESLELAYLRNPTFRDRETARQVTQAQEDQQRQRKLGALGGSGSPPVRKTTPSTPEDRRTAMVREIREAVNGG